MGFLLSSKFIVYWAPGYAHLPASKLLHRDKFLAPRQFCTAIAAQTGFDQVPAPGQIPGRPQACTAITPARQLNCTMMAKTAPCFAPCGLRKLESY